MKPNRNENKTEIQFTMRMEKELYEILTRNASKNKRSIRKEIEYELEQYNKTDI